MLVSGVLSPSLISDDSEGSGEGQFSQPAGTAIDGSGNLWVSDYNNGRIEKFSPAGKFVASYGTKGGGNGQFLHPTGIAPTIRSTKPVKESA